MTTKTDKAAIAEMFTEQPSALKFDSEKLDWHSFPLVVMEGIIKVAVAGCMKYDRFNCLNEFANGDQRLFSAAMRHTVAAQINPLAVDEETGCLHGYMAAWNLIMRTWHAERASNGRH